MTIKLPSIAQLAKKHDIRPLKKFGQNFLYDLALCSKIAGTQGELRGKHILEIGPGPAGLTRAILAADPAKLTVIETDERCIGLLFEIQNYYPNLDILHNDALKISLASITSNDNKITIIANLPYNISTVLIANWLEECRLIESISVTIQKEVAMRLIAKHSCKEYGRLSILVQLFCDVEKCFDISPKAFYPAPKVWSSVVKLTPKQHFPSKMLLAKIELLTQHAFAQRRKMLQSSIAAIAPNIIDIITDLGLSPKDRAENLSPEAYLAIAERL